MLVQVVCALIFFVVCPLFGGSVVVLLFIELNIPTVKDQHQLGQWEHVARAVAQWPFEWQ